MKSIVLGFVLLSVASAPQIIGQQNPPTGQKTPLHLSGGTERVYIGFTADGIERQDPSTPSASPYASVVRLKGNVVIRTCCIQRGASRNKPKQVMSMRADEAEFHQDTGEIEVSGNVWVTFQNYPK